MKQEALEGRNGWGCSDKQ